MDDARLTWHCENWRTWQEDRKSDFGRGYPSRASSRMGQSGSRDFDSMVAAADGHCARAVDAIVDGLPPVERCAVYHVHLAARFPYPATCAMDVYELARAEIRRGLMKRGID